MSQDQTPRTSEPKREPLRVFHVGRSRFEQLLVSRRKLERVDREYGKLLDPETWELFVLDAASSAALAKGA